MRMLPARRVPRAQIAARGALLCAGEMCIRDSIYIASDELFTLTGEAALLAQEAEFALDAEVFPEEEYILYISDVGPDRCV